MTATKGRKCSRRPGPAELNAALLARGGGGLRRGGGAAWCLSSGEVRAAAVRRAAVRAMVVAGAASGWPGAVWCAASMVDGLVRGGLPAESGGGQAGQPVPPAGFRAFV